MDTTNVVEKFLKATVTRDQVEAERQERLSRPDVVSSEIADDGTNWVLTTVLGVD